MQDADKRQLLKIRRYLCEEENIRSVVSILFIEEYRVTFQRGKQAVHGQTHIFLQLQASAKFENVSFDLSINMLVSVFVTIQHLLPSQMFDIVFNEVLFE